MISGKEILSRKKLRENSERESECDGKKSKDRKATKKIEQAVASQLVVGLRIEMRGIITIGKTRVSIF